MQGSHVVGILFKIHGHPGEFLGQYGMFGCRKMPTDKQWQLTHFIADVERDVTAG
jgi:hypothetical protein